MELTHTKITNKSKGNKKKCFRERAGSDKFSERWISADWSGWCWLDVNDNFKVKFKEQTLSKLTDSYLILIKSGGVECYDPQVAIQTHLMSRGPMVPVPLWVPGFLASRRKEFEIDVSIEFKVSLLVR